jgi:hypothetical protein
MQGMMNVGIIGSGANMNRHVMTLKKIQDVRIIGCYSSMNRQKKIADSNGIAVYPDPDSLIDDADAIIMTDSDKHHNKLVVKTIRKAKHVLLYPMMVRSIHEAMQFMKLAHEANVLLKVGNVGNINLYGLQRMMPGDSGIKFIELHYYKCITKTPAANPILEALLINAQVIQSLVKSQILSVKAKGLIMSSVKPEIVNARLEFHNGCTVNITCNLVAARDDFQATIVLKDRCIKYDFLTQKLTSWNIQPKRNHYNSPFFIDNVKITHHDLLLDELTDFISSSGSEAKHHISTESGFEPFLLTEKILEKVRKSVIQYT